MDFTKYLEEMLAEGMTAEEIADLAQEVKVKLDDTKAAKEKKEAEITKARVAYMTAYLEYLRVLTGYRPEAKLVEEFEEGLKKAENDIERLSNRISTQIEYKETKEEREKAVQDTFEDLYSIIEDIFSK